MCGGRERTREWRCAFASLLAVCACAREAVIRSVRYSLFSVSMLLSSYESSHTRALGWAGGRAGAFRPPVVIIFLFKAS